MRVLYIEQVGGVSGDMFLALLIGLGVEPAGISSALSRLGLAGVSIEARRVERCGVPAILAEVRESPPPSPGTLGAGARLHPGGGPEPAHGHHHPGQGPEHAHGHLHPGGGPGHTHGHHDPGQGPEPAHSHRGFTEIAGMIESSPLPAPVIEKAVRVFRRLGEAEAKVHDIPLERVHFHEVGAVDSIADIVGTCWGLHELGVERLISSPFVFGRGEVRMAHGVWPVPAPATVLLTEGRPVTWIEVEGETVTPTGAALVTALADSIGVGPAMTVTGTAAGAGHNDWPGRANVLRGWLGEAGRGSLPEEAVEVLETQVDDVNPQTLAALAPELLDAGALDVTITPVLMKKGRPGFILTVLARPGEAASLAGRIFAGLPTLGIRFRTERRWVLPRRSLKVATPWGGIAVKVAELPDGSRRLTPEFDDCLRASREAGVPLDHVMAVAREAAGRVVAAGNS